MKDISTLINDLVFVKRVQYVLILLFVFLIGLDIYLVFDKIDNNTISNIIKNNTDDGLFILTYFWGVLAANLFITKKRKPFINPIYGATIVIIIAILIAVFNIELKTSTIIIDNQYNFSTYIVSMLFGFIIGFIFWRQKHNVSL